MRGGDQRQGMMFSYVSLEHLSRRGLHAAFTIATRPAGLCRPLFLVPVQVFVPFSIPRSNLFFESVFLGWYLKGVEAWMRGLRCRGVSPTWSFRGRTPARS